MAINRATPRCCIQHSRFTKQDGWRLRDLSLSLNGNIAVTGDNVNTHGTCIDVYTNVRHSDSRDKPKMIYSKEWEIYTAEDGWWYRGRLVSFYPGSDTTILSGLGDKLEVIDLIEDRVMKFRKIKLLNHGGTKCLSIRETEIFIGFYQSNKISVYDVIDLNEIKSIILQGIEDGYWPYDMTAIADRIFVCVGDGKEESNDKSLIFEEKNGRILSELTEPTDTVQWYVEGVALNVSLNVIAVVWSQTQKGKSKGIDVIVFYSLLSESNCSFLIVEVEFGIYRIRISDRGDRMITGDHVAEECKVYGMANFFTYDHLRENLISQLQRDECVRLMNYFALPHHQADAIVKSGTPKGNLLLALEERGVIKPSNVGRLIEAFHEINITSSCYYLLDFYRQTRRVTSYDRFLATLSAHLTVSLPEDLCGYFKITDEKKNSITLSENPGLSLLMALDEMGVIKSSEVETLELPLTELKLVQAVAKIHEYQSIVKEEKRQLLEGVELAMEAKKRIFIQCLQKKIKSWYETMTPVPWKKSCRWKSAELFVGSGLVLTDSKAKRSLMDIDDKCKLKYTEIFCHESLKEETRIILEGDPGTGKTMLASQLAYDWSLGKITEINILIFLPLKFVKRKSLVASLRKFYVPENRGLSESDIEGFLTDGGSKCCFILDGLEEYNGGEEPSEVMQVMAKNKYPSCKVILTSRSEYAQNLPPCPMLKLGKFGEAERNAYIEKVFSENEEKKFEVKRVIEDNPFILDLCNIPVLFVLAVHNIESMKGIKKGSLDRVSPFMASMVDTLCSSIISNVTAVKSKYQKHGDASLEEIAFNGLCKGYQELFWPKEDIENRMPNSKQWLDSGIIVVDDTNVSLDEEKNEHQILSSGKGEASNSTAVQRSEPTTLSELVEYLMSRGKAPDVISSAPTKVPDLISSPPSKQKPGVIRRLVKRIRKGPRSVKSRSTADASLLSSSGQESPSHLASKVKDKMAGKARFKAKHVGLQVKFLHKLMQEWFAARHFASEYAKLGSHNARETWLRENLSSINPTDLHYVLRFSCNLYAPCTHHIMKHLLTSYHSEEGSIPQHIMNCAFLCFAEFEGDPGTDLLEAVTMVCNKNIIINSEDSRLLQQAKASMLKLASDSGIIVKKIVLADLVISATNDFLTFNSGVTMEVIDTLHVIEMSRWDQKLKEEDYPDIFKYIGKCDLLEEVNLYFPAQPPQLDKETLIELEIDHKRVTWMIGSGVRQTLNTTTGEWQLRSKSQVSSTHPESEETQNFHYFLEAKATITKNGGVLEIPNTNVSLTIPPDSLPEYMEHCKMQLRIIPRGTMKEQVTLFHLNSSIVVELLPDSLKFRQPVRLTIPHCWVLQGTGERKAKIYISHQGPGAPEWEEQTHISYHLEDTACIILLNSFCLVKFSVDTEVVEAIKLIVYTAARSLQPVDKVAEIHVGYYWDSPDERMVAHCARDLVVAHRKSFFFFVRKGKEHPLRISLDNIFPSNWHYHSAMPLARDVAYEQVVSLARNVVIYTLVKEDNKSGNPLCVFTVSQDSGQIAVQLAAHLKMTDTQPLSAGHVESAVESLDQYGAPLKAEMTVTSAGGTLTIKGSEVKLEIPPDAIPTQRKECLIRMTINPTRVVEDQDTSFCSNSCTSVDISPSKLKLHYPAKLTLPHCLKLVEKEGLKARIFFNEEEGTASPWREQQNLEHELNDSSCIVHLEKLCCVKYSIDKRIVKGKRITLYSAAQSVKQEDRLADADIGYYSDIPGGGELLQLNPNLEIDSETEVLFMEGQKFGLKLLLDCVIPSEWKYCVPNQNPQEIPYNVIASSIEHSHLYVLQKEKDYPGSVICKFVASQENSHMSSELSLRIRPQQGQPKGTNQAEQQVKKADTIMATITRLSPKLGNSWKFVGRNLGLDDIVLDDIEKIYNHQGTWEQSYQMLVKWKNKSGSDLSYAELIQALEIVNRRDLADDVKDWTGQQNA